MFKSKHSYVDFLEGILIGGSLGAAATFIFGTEKGKKLQKEVSQKYKKLERKAGHYRHNVEKAFKSPAAKKLQKEIRQTYKTLSHKADDYRKGIEKALKSPAAKKAKRIAKKTARSRVARKIVRKVKSKIVRRRKALR